MDSDFCKENKNQNEPFLDLMLDSVNEEISDCEELLSRLKAEYTAHANFIMHGPFEHRDLSQSSANKIESPQPFG